MAEEALRLISFAKRMTHELFYVGGLIKHLYCPITGLQNAAFQCCADCQNHFCGCDRFLADNRQFHPGLLLHPGACCLRPDAGIGRYAGQRVDARDIAGKKRNDDDAFESSPSQALKTHDSSQAAISGENRQGIGVYVLIV